jgi:nitrogen regulatory protein PII
LNETRTDKCTWFLLSVIVDCGYGSKVLRIARRSGITGGTIVPARGTLGDRYPRWFDDYECSKEIVLMISDEESTDRAIDELNRGMKLNKPNHGIAFIMSITDLLGSSHCRMDSKPLQEGADSTMQKAIFVVVDKGEAEQVVQSAEAAGARGMTIINARGAGVHETSKLFSMEIEPEKEIVLIIAQSELVDDIAGAVHAAMKLDEPGKGILFIVDVRKSFGLYD